MDDDCPILVHAIIVNFQTPDLTIDAVRSLYESDLRDIELHLSIVDNGSGDDSADILRHRFPEHRHFRSSRNLGFAGGNNLALRAILDEFPADRDPHHCYVLLMNSDIIVEADALANCLQYLETHSQTGVVGPRVVLPDGKLDLACRRAFPTPSSGFWKLTGLARRFPNSTRLARYNLTYLDEFTTAEVDSIMGAFMLIRMRAIQQTGILDEGFFFYGEDLDWSFRFKAHGWRVVYHPAALVHHLKGGTSRRNSNRMIIEFYRAMWLFYRKHYAKRQFILLKWIVLAGILGRGLVALGINAMRPAGRKRVA